EAPVAGPPDAVGRGRASVTTLTDARFPGPYTVKHLPLASALMVGLSVKPLLVRAQCVRVRRAATGIEGVHRHVPPTRVVMSHLARASRSGPVLHAGDGESQSDTWSVPRRCNHHRYLRQNPGRGATWAVQA